MLKKIKKTLKGVKRYLNKKGNEMVAIALVLIFIILAGAPYIKKLGETTANGIDKLNTEMEDVLDGKTE